jgi:hypothetical protein
MHEWDMVTPEMSYSTTCVSQPSTLEKPPALSIAAVLCWFILISAHTASALDQTHTLSPSYHAAMIQSDADSTYTFHSPGINYNVFLGKAFGFRGRAAIFFPIHLFQDSRYFNARDTYSFALGAEALLGAAYTAKLKDEQLVIVDIGAHLNGMKLGSDVYQTFYSLTFGVGACVEYFYPINRLWTIGSFIGVAGHFLDFIHDANGLKFGVFVSAGITVGFRSFKKKSGKKRSAP